MASHVYSGHEHVERGKPQPDIYLYAAAQIETPIERCVIIEDLPVGVKGRWRPALALSESLPVLIAWTVTARCWGDLA